jgi:hypothetical protein
MLTAFSLVRVGKGALLLKTPEPLEVRVIEVRLYDESFGLVVPAATGVIYIASCAGTSLAEMRLEGFFVPLDPLILGSKDMEGAMQLRPRILFDFCSEEVRSAEELWDVVDHVLSLGGNPIPVTVDRTSERESHEAWMWVRHERSPRVSRERPGAFYTDEDYDDMLWPFWGRPAGSAVLVWPNTD